MFANLYLAYETLSKAMQAFKGDQGKWGKVIRDTDIEAD